MEQNLKRKKNHIKNLERKEKKNKCKEDEKGINKENEAEELIDLIDLEDTDSLSPSEDNMDYNEIEKGGNLGMGNLMANNYFISRRIGKGKHKLTNSLGNLPERQEVYDILSKLDEPSKTSLSFSQCLEESFEKEFRKWRAELFFGFNLLFTGFGSKIVLLENFAFGVLKDHKIVCINGHLQGLHIKSIINYIWEKILGEKLDKTRTSIEKCKSICSHFSEEYGTEVFPDQLNIKSSIYRLILVIHSIDGIALRSWESQTCLSILAQAKWIHIVASVDHVNAPILWSDTHLHRLNWVRHHTPTCRPYTDEVLIELPSREKERVKSIGEVNYILKSLTPNHLEILKILARNQIETGTSMKYEELITLCRSKLLIVGGDTILRSALAELMTHHLIKFLKNKDNAEIIQLQLNQSVIESTLIEIKQAIHESLE